MAEEQNSSGLINLLGLLAGGAALGSVGHKLVPKAELEVLNNHMGKLGWGDRAAERFAQAGAVPAGAWMGYQGADGAQTGDFKGLGGAVGAVGLGYGGEALGRKLVTKERMQKLLKTTDPVDEESLIMGKSVGKIPGNLLGSAVGYVGGKDLVGALQPDRSAYQNPYGNQ